MISNTGTAIRNTVCVVTVALVCLLATDSPPDLLVVTASPTMQQPDTGVRTHFKKAGTSDIATTTTAIATATDAMSFNLSTALFSNKTATCAGYKLEWKYTSPSWASYPPIQSLYINGLFVRQKSLGFDGAQDVSIHSCHYVGHMIKCI
jgi:hypothetical protein